MSDNDARALGIALRDHRARNGMTQRELAELAGVSVRTVRAIEQGQVRHPRQASLRQLAGVLDAERPRPDRLHIDVLGALTVRLGDRAVEVGSLRQRCLLGLFALHANEIVTRAEIVDVLWDDRPPATYQTMLHTMVSRLRKILDDGTDRIIASRQHGYVLEIDPRHLDLTRFVDLEATARRAPQPDATLDLFDRALSCWRGPVLADLPERLREHPAAIAVAQKRMSVVLSYADIAMDMAAHEQAAVWLRTLVHDEPFHEGLHARLMLALAGMGQQATALALFARIRDRLRTELAVEPGEELRTAHQKVLHGQIPARTATAVTPAQLPLSVPHFTGRTEHLDQLTGLLDGRQAGGTALIAAITGTAGIGKTTLAVRWAHQVADRFPDGQFYVNLRGFAPTGPLAPADAVRGFLDALDVPRQQIPTGLDAQTALYRSLLSGRRALILLDNARDAEHVRPLLPGAPGCLTVITSRNQLSSLVAAEGAHPITLDLLTPAESRQFLAARLGPDRLAAEPHAADEIIDQCARLPLALAVIAARAAGHPTFPLTRLAEELRQGRDRLDPYAADPDTDMRAVLAWSYRTVSPPAGRLFRLLSLHPGPDIGVRAAATIAATSTRETQRLLDELCRTHLLNEHHAGRYSFHDLLRAYATELANTLDPAEDRRAATRRMLDYYRYNAHNAARLFDSRGLLAPDPPLPDVTQDDISRYEHAVAWFTTEHQVLIAVLDVAATSGFDTHTWRLAWALVPFLDRYGHWNDLHNTQSTALATVLRSGASHAEPNARRLLGLAHLRQSRYEDAHRQLRLALKAFQDNDDHTVQAHTLLKISITYQRQGRVRAALRHAEQCLRLHQHTDNQVGQATALNAIGWYHALLGDYASALVHCQQALELLTEHGDIHGQALTWDSLGQAHHHLDNHRRAVSSYQQALQLHRQLGDRYHEAQTLIHLGDTHHRAADLTAAREAWRQALAIFAELDLPDTARIRIQLDNPPRSTTAMIELVRDVDDQANSATFLHPRAVTNSTNSTTTADR